MENEFTLKVPREDAYLYVSLVRKLSIEQAEQPYQRLISQLEANERSAQERFVKQFNDQNKAEQSKV